MNGFAIDASGKMQLFVLIYEGIIDTMLVVCQNNTFTTI